MRLFIILLFIMLTGCYQNKVEIVINKDKIYSKKNYYKKNRLKFSDISKKNLENLNSNSNIAVAKSNPIENKNNAAEVIVNPGDTLYGISATYNIPNRDLIEINNLNEPYILKVGQRIKLPSFEYHKVQSGDNLNSIARMYDMKIANLIKLNDLEKPYNIKSGDKIRISETASIKRDVKKRKPKTKKLPIIANNSKFIWPVKSGTIISKFGQKAGGLYNDGINIKTNGNDDAISVKDGKVVYVGNELRGYGNLIIIKHANNWISAYAHLDDILVQKGQKIEQGTKIANIGATGNVSEKQLYFSLRKKKEAVNPEKYLEKKK